MALRKINQVELDEILRLHLNWLNEDPTGIKACITSTDFLGTSLRYVIFCYADLQESDFRFSDLSFSNFKGANLQNSDFMNSNLQGLCFQKADLRGVNFQESNLQHIDFRGALLNQPIPHNANIKFSLWHLPDIPWWMGHPGQDQIILFDQ